VIDAVPGRGVPQATRDPTIKSPTDTVVKLEIMFFPHQSRRI
jgi:hypothetical protein